MVRKVTGFHHSTAGGGRGKGTPAPAGSRVYAREGQMFTTKAKGAPRRSADKPLSAEDAKRLADAHAMMMEAKQIVADVLDGVPARSASRFRPAPATPIERAAHAVALCERHVQEAEQARDWAAVEMCRTALRGARRTLVNLCTEGG